MTFYLHCLSGKLCLPWWFPDSALSFSGVHIVQLFYGCEWDDEVENITGYHRYGYDGEDFIVFDLKTETWIAPKEQAFLTKLNWNGDADGNTEIKNYLTQECVDWLKKYVNYGCCTLMRTGRIIQFCFMAVHVQKLWKNVLLICKF